MSFNIHTPWVRQAGAALVLGLFVVTGVLPLLTAPIAGALARRAPDCAERVQARLFFGLRGSAGLVSEADWDSFLTTVITPRFPDGLTVLEANGQWRDSVDGTLQEPSRVVEIVYDDSPDARHRLAAIVEIYKGHYRQQSVMVARSRLEVCF
jgi:hypothetical protein